MEMETARLSLRAYDKKDGEALYAMLSDPETVYYEPYDPLSLKEACLEAARRAEDPAFIAVCLKDGPLIGTLYFSRGDFDTYELGYVFTRAYWGMGYALEAARALIDRAFSGMGARRITAMASTRNIRSLSLLNRLGMRREGVFIRNVFFKYNAQGEPDWLDSCAYALLKEEWASSSR